MDRPRRRNIVQVDEHEHTPTSFCCFLFVRSRIESHWMDVQVHKTVHDARVAISLRI